jgi:hypothetical protein
MISAAFFFFGGGIIPNRSVICFAALLASIVYVCRNSLYGAEALGANG